MNKIRFLKNGYGIWFSLVDIDNYLKSKGIDISFADKTRKKQHKICSLELVYVNDVMLCISPFDEFVKGLVLFRDLNQRLSIKQKRNLKALISYFDMTYYQLDMNIFTEVEFLCKMNESQ